MSSAHRPLRITWILPFLHFTGGNRVVYEHTRELLRRGHEVTIVVPQAAPVPWTRAGRKALLGVFVEALLLRSMRMVRFFGLEDRIHRVPALDPAHFPDGDVILATAWDTADAVAKAPRRCGRGAYLIQHYEAFAAGSEDAVDATWRLPLEKIVIARWLADLGRERFGVSVWGPIINGVDHDLFHERGRGENDPPVVGFMYERIPWKGTADAIAAVGIARRTVPGLRVLMFGRHRLRETLRAGDRFVRNPSPERLAKLYRACDFFVSPSWTEGWGLPAMEAMASGCALVATETGWVPDHGKPGETLLAVPPQRPDRIAAELVRLATDRPLARRIAAAGVADAGHFRWSLATDQLESVLREIVAGRSAQVAGSTGSGERPA